jgi:plasmid stabilization system protein ParE
MNFTESFEKTASGTYRWLCVKWSLQSANKFAMQLQIVIDKIGKNPNAGRRSGSFRNIRSISVTRYNRIYYRISGDIIELLELFETRQNPEKNKYE